MPFRKEISRLEDLCVCMVARDLPRHAKNLKRCKANTDLCMLYLIIQSLFTDKFQKGLGHIHRKKENDDNLLGLHKEWEQEDNLLCLNFLLNEHTSCACFATIKMLQISAEDFVITLRKCKGLQFLQMKNENFPERLFLSSIPKWKNLLKIDLFNSSCNDEIFQEILKNCTDIRILKVTGISVTNNSLFYLCNNRGISKTVRFCEKQGKCCSLGRKLTSLTIYGTNINGYGLMCALQHLMSLTELEDGELCSGPRSRIWRLLTSNSVYFAINELRKVCKSMNVPDPQLQLKILHVPQLVIYRGMGRLNLPGNLRCCRRLETLRVEIPLSSADFEIFTLNCFHSLRTLSLNSFQPLESSSDFLQFLRVTGKQLDTISIDGFSITLTLIEVILENCKNLRQLHLGHKRCFAQWNSDRSISISEGDFVNDAGQMFHNAHKIEKLWFHFLSFSSDRAERFLCDLLIRATNVKSVTICSTLVEHCLTNIMGKNNFHQLEEISLRDADLEHISLHPLFTSHTNLKKITYCECRNVESFTVRHKHLAKINNFEVIIEEIPSL